MSNFYPVITQDGTLSLYNTEVNDVYHSHIGAYTEALNKFVLPSGILGHVKNNNQVSILDICFGLGYNSKVAITEIWKVNPNCKISVTALEMDYYVLAYSCLADFKEINPACRQSFIDTIDKIIDIKDIFLDVNFKSLISEYLILDPIQNNPEVEKDSFLHNIYYRTISNRNKKTDKAYYKSDLLNISIYSEDARQSISDIKPYYDFIFHDPFTPSKAPMLWTVEFFKKLFFLLSNYGNLTTYSCSGAVRSALLEVGFSIGNTSPIGRKASGTIATKSNKFINNPLTEKELGLLKTNAGIPYHDEKFSLTNDEIILKREEIQKKSNRPSSGSYLKINNLYN